MNTEALPENVQRDIDLVMELMAIPGRSGEEAATAAYIEKHLIDAGADPSHIVRDTANQRTLLQGDTGNLIYTMPAVGDAFQDAPRRMLSAHLDTVPVCVGSQPQREGEMVRSADPATGLGADNRAGCAVLLSTALHLLENDLPHPPLTFVWFVQEEIGLHGARQIDLPLLGDPQLAFNWDGGTACKLTTGATGGYRMMIEIKGVASHAGGAPEWGVSAIAIAGLAIADLHRCGWHGAIKQGGKLGTSNIGVIEGGAATNVVANRVTLKAEARSHDPEFRKEIVNEIESAFRRAAAEVQNAAGVAGEVSFEGRLDYEAFRLERDHPSVTTAASVIEAMGHTPEYVVANGGLDANWLYQHGVHAVSLGCGQLLQHTVEEALDLEQFKISCEIALRLATARE